MEPVQLTVALACSCFLWLWLRRDSISSLSLPPGPRGLPIIGNALRIPSSMPWKVFRDWSLIYGIATRWDLMGQASDCFEPGDVMLLKIPTQRILVLSSVQAAVDLLEKRSDIYSSRPYIRMLDMYVEY